MMDILRVAGHLQATLEELNVPADLVTEVMTIAASPKMRFWVARLIKLRGSAVWLGN